MESEFEKERSRRLEQLAKLPWRTDDKSYGPFEIGLRLAATERELAETRRQLDEEQRKNIYLELDLEEERSIFEATNNGAKQCAEERDKLRRQRDLLLEAARGIDPTIFSDSALNVWHQYERVEAAIRECEPPKPTRRERVIELLEEFDEPVRLATPEEYADFILAALDALDGGGQ